jgi:hypothetical protein
VRLTWTTQRGILSERPLEHIDGANATEVLDRWRRSNPWYAHMNAGEFRVQMVMQTDAKPELAITDERILDAIVEACPELALDRSAQPGTTAAARDDALAELSAAARRKREAEDELRRLEVVRSRSVVGDLGESMAAAYYGVELPLPSTPGYDLVDKRDRRIQVRTLHCAAHLRRDLGRMKDPCDALLAIRLNEDYEPAEAIEVARNLLPATGERFRWTRELEENADERITGVELRAAWRGEWTP